MSKDGVTTIFHVSDLHFGRPAVPEQIEAIETMIQEGEFDVVAVSGDVSQRARAGEFQRAAVFLRDAQKVSQTIVVPGNHDVRWWRAPLGIGPYPKIFDAYKKWVFHDLEPVLSIPSVTLVGLNTSHGVTYHTLTRNVRDISIIGYVTRSQLETLREKFDRAPADDARVVVMHHNPVKGELSQRHGLKNTQRILGAFAEMGVDVVLCGHDHQEAVHYIEHTRKGTVISTAGTVSNRSRGGRPSSVNLITVLPEAIEVTTLVWSQKQGTFVRGPHQSFARAVPAKSA
ncbi:MAG: metallophosphoesterase [Gemmatimonadaceae bacterium]|nr:metallophosphoesterase [Gemmatimonadaceae bacterium]